MQSKGKRRESEPRPVRHAKALAAYLLLRLVALANPGKGASCTITVLRSPGGVLLLGLEVGNWHWKNLKLIHTM